MTLKDNVEVDENMLNAPREDLLKKLTLPTSNKTVIIVNPTPIAIGFIYKIFIFLCIFYFLMVIFCKILLKV